MWDWSRKFSKVKKLSFYQKSFLQELSYLTLRVCFTFINKSVNLLWENAKAVDVENKLNTVEFAVKVRIFRKFWICRRKAMWWIGWWRHSYFLKVLILRMICDKFDAITTNITDTMKNTVKRVVNSRDTKELYESKNLQLFLKVQGNLIFFRIIIFEDLCFSFIFWGCSSKRA